MKTDFLVIGSGCAGLYCALHLPENKQVTVITKSDVESSDSYLAQGGICILRDDSDYDSFFEDTMKAGHYKNDETSVDIMISYSQNVLEDLLSYGVNFQRQENDELLYTKEGGHSGKRILFYEDLTGKEITSKLLARAKERPNITILEHTTMVDIVSRDNECLGAIIRKEDGSLTACSAGVTVMATGGIGGLFNHSTNFSHLTGDAIAIAVKHGIALKDIDYVQIHPTTFYDPESEDGKSFLISESVRGEGAILLNKNMERFTDELQPRDIVTKAIREQMEKDGTPHVWEDLRPIPEEELRDHFPNIVEHCRQKGYDVTKEPIPVVPAQHYFMGGIDVDYFSKTTMDRLYAVGETACNGVHGKNRLASNSLLESLVFAKRAAIDMRGAEAFTDEDIIKTEHMDLTPYEDAEALEQEYKDLVLNAIKKASEEKK